MAAKSEAREPGYPFVRRVGEVMLRGRVYRLTPPVRISGNLTPDGMAIPADDWLELREKAERESLRQQRLHFSTRAGLQEPGK